MEGKVSAASVIMTDSRWMDYAEKRGSSSLSSSSPFPHLLSLFLSFSIIRYTRGSIRRKAMMADNGVIKDDTVVRSGESASDEEKAAVAPHEDVIPPHAYTAE